MLQRRNAMTVAGTHYFKGLDDWVRSPFVPKGYHLIAKDCRYAALLVTQNVKNRNLDMVPSSQRVAWQKTIKLFEDGCVRPRQVALFPEDCREVVSGIVFRLFGRAAVPSRRVMDIRPHFARNPPDTWSMRAFVRFCQFLRCRSSAARGDARPPCSALFPTAPASCLQPTAPRHLISLKFL